MSAAALALAGLSATAKPAAAEVVPFVDCVTAGTGTVSVYFGYTNDGTQQTIAFGDENEVVPGLGYQGQPEIFNRGTYQRVFRAVWNQEAFTAISWFLNGHEAVATHSGPNPSPTCVAGATGPVSDLTPTTATLSATVGVARQQTSYSFEYGPGASLALSTPPAAVGTGQHSFVQEQLTGLTPGTAYSYRVLASDEDGTTEGEVRTFTTPLAPVPSPPAPPPGPFVVAARGASARSIAAQRQDCGRRPAGGVVVFSDRAGTASIRAKLGKLTVASRQVALASGRNVFALCLNKAGRKRLGGGGALRALAVVTAQADDETAWDSAPVRFPRASAGRRR